MGQRSTSYWLDAGAAVHHPGPLQFYILGVLSAPFNFEPWSILGAGVVFNGYVSFISIRMTFRHIGTLAAMATTCSFLLIEFAGGPDWMIYPFNMSGPAMPLAGLCSLTWVVAAVAGVGVRAGTMPAGNILLHWILIWSYVVQAHLALLPFGVATLVFLIVIIQLASRRSRRMSGHAQPVQFVSRGAMSVLVLAWLPVAIELITYDPNQLTQIIRYVDSPQRAQVRGWGFAWNYLSSAAVPAFAVNPLLVGEGTRSPIVFICTVSVLAFAAFGYLLSVKRNIHVQIQDMQSVRAYLCGAGVCLVLLAACAWPLSRLEVGRASFYGSVFIPVALFSVCASTAIGIFLVSQAVSSSFSLPIRERRSLGEFVGVLIASSSLAACSSWPTTYLNPSATRDFTKGVTAAITARVPNGTCVNILSPGVQGWTRIAPTLAFRLERGGYPSHFKIFWPFPEDDDFRKNETAPASCWRVLLREQTGGVWNPDAPPQAQVVGSMNFEAALGFEAAEVQAFILAPTG